MNKRISYLRAIACIAIIILHTAYIANITFTDSYGIIGNIVSNTARNLMLWAVPNFVMISGVLLLDPQREITLKKIYTKYVKRILLALIVFCIIYQIFDSALIDHNLGLGSILTGFKEAILGTSWSTMWYPYTLISLYILLPFYRIIAKRATSSEMRYLLFVYLLFLSIFPILRIWGIRLGFSINVSTIYPFYFFAGFAIYRNLTNPESLDSHANSQNKIPASAGIVLATVGSVMTIIFTCARYVTGNESFEMFRDYNAINVVLQSLGIFIAFFGNGRPLVKSKRFSKILLSLDANSFGIYLIHIIIIKWLFRVISFDPYGLFWPISFTAIVIGNLLVSWGITIVLRKVPGFRSIL